MSFNLLDHVQHTLERGAHRAFLGTGEHVVRRHKNQVEIIDAAPVKQIGEAIGFGTLNQTVVIANIADSYFNEIIETSVRIGEEGVDIVHTSCIAGFPKARPLPECERECEKYCDNRGSIRPVPSHRITSSFEHRAGALPLGGRSIERAPALQRCRCVLKESCFSRLKPALRQFGTGETRLAVSWKSNDS